MSLSLCECTVEMLSGSWVELLTMRVLEQRKSEHSMQSLQPRSPPDRPWSQLAKPQPLLCQPPAGPTSHCRLCKSGRATWWSLEARSSPDASQSWVQEGLMEALLPSSWVSPSHCLVINPNVQSRADTHNHRMLYHLQWVVTKADTRGQVGH